MLYHLQRILAPMQTLPSEFPHNQKNLYKETLRQTNLAKAQNNTVIPIPNDGQQESLIDNKLIQAHFHFQILQADMTGSFLQKILAICRFIQPGQTYKQKDGQLKSIIKDFFLVRMRIDIQIDFFCEKIDVGLLNQPGMVYDNRILLYGIDLLTSNQNILHTSFQNARKKYLDSSHCLLEFRTPDEAMIYIRGKIGTSDSGLLFHLQTNPNTLSGNWIELFTYEQLGFKRKVFARYYTQADQIFIANKKSPVIDFFKEYLNVKADIPRFLLMNKQVNNKFEQIKKEELIKQAFYKKPTKKPIYNSKRNDDCHRHCCHHNRYDNPYQYKPTFTRRPDQRDKTYDCYKNMDNKDNPYNYSDSTYSHRKTFIRHQNNYNYQKNKYYNPRSNNYNEFNKKSYNETRTQFNRYSQMQDKDNQQGSWKMNTVEINKMTNQNQENNVQRNIENINQNKNITDSFNNNIPPQITVNTINQTQTENAKNKQKQMKVKLNFQQFGRVDYESNSQFSTLAKNLNNIHLLSQYSSIGERSKHNISNSGFVFDSHDNMDSTPLNYNLSSNHQSNQHSSQQPSSLFEVQNQNPDFLIQEIQQPKEHSQNNAVIKLETRDNYEDLLPNLSEKEKPEQAEDLDDWQGKLAFKSNNPFVESTLSEPSQNSNQMLKKKPKKRGNKNK